MNPQYVPPQQFGMPPQGFPTNRASPSLGGPPPSSQGFQSVPLGPPKASPSQSPAIPPSSTPNITQFPSNIGPPNANLKSQVPPSQLPPQRPPSGPSPNQFGLSHASKPGDPQGIHNGSSQFINGPAQFQNGPGSGPPSSTPGSLPPQGQHPSNITNKPLGPPQGSNQFGQTNQSQPPRPGQPSLSNPSPFAAQSIPQNPLLASSQPPLSGPSSLNQQPSSGPPSRNQQPLLGPSSLNQHPPLQGGFPPSNHHSLNNQLPPLNPQPLSNQQPLTGPAYPSQQAPNYQQPLVGQPPVNQQPLGGPPPQAGLLQQPRPGPPSNQPQQAGLPQLNQQSPAGPPPLNQQPLTGPPPLNQQPPTGPPQQARIAHPLNQQPLTGPPPLNQQPPIGPLQQARTGQPLLAGPPPQNQPPFQLNHQALGTQPLSRGPPSMNTQPPVPGPPLPGQQNSGFNQSQFGQPIASFPPNRQFNQPPLPGSNQPGMPNQPPMPGPNQLTNQMQGMNIGGPRQYPGAPVKGTLNGDNGPHMPPPITQQQYMNGQQMRSPPGPGYPPMPGQQQPGPGGMAGYPQPAYQQPQQAKRLDPDQMPSPIQVTQDDQQNRSGVFCTNQKGLVPPLVTTKFVVQDQGNSSPRYIRSSMYNVPISQDIMKQTAVPFSLVISPMARTVDQEYPPPIVNFGELGPVRCIRCKAYMCPFMQFIDSGRRFQCLFCKATTDVPSEYFQHLDHTGQRIDRYERPELVLGTYEMVATAEYCRNNTLPKPPAIIFVIDVSYNSVKSGLVHLLCSQIKDIIQNLPIDQGQEKSNMRVGFITYNSSVHFYNIKGNLAAPQMLIVGDIQEMFMPLLDGFLCTPEESGPVIDALMQQIPAMFGETRETETILLPAILAGLEALKASDCAGKLLVFHSTLPTADGPGKLKNRDDRKLLGTDKERTVLTPQTQAYNQLGQDCVGAGCSVDLFIFNNAYIDIATIGQVSRLTGGQVHKYTYFQADIDGDRLIGDIITNISRPIAFDAIMRVRTSTGVRPTDFYGHFFMSNTTDLEFAAVDCDKAVAIEVKHDDKLSEEEGVYVQAALLYTSCSGERRLRIINLSLKTCSQMADLYRNCDCDTIINYIAKQSTYKLYEHNPKAVKDSIVTRAAQILATYRKNCASPSSAGQLILPECMKLLPLYVNCLLKSDALSGGSDMTLDDRAYVMQEVMTMDIPTSVNYFYPRLIPLHELDETQDPVEIPSPIRCTLDKMNEQGVYLLENGIHMFLWIGLGASPDFIQKVFGVPSAIQVDIEKVALPELDNSLSMAVRNIIDEIRMQRHKCMRLTIVRQREKLEPVFKHFLAEDRGTDGSPSYVDFLIHMHKEIRALLS